MATTAFRALAAEVAATQGLPDIRLVSVEHPLGGADAASILDRADTAIEPALRLLTAPTQ